MIVAQLIDILSTVPSDYRIKISASDTEDDVDSCRDIEDYDINDKLQVIYITAPNKGF
jgi:hypothetical protein